MKRMFSSGSGQAILVMLVVLTCGCLMLVTAGLAMRIWLPDPQRPAQSVAASPTLTGRPSQVMPLPTETSVQATATPLPPLTISPQATPTETPQRAPQASATPAPLPTSTQQLLNTEERLLAAELPQRDMRSLAERLKKTGPIPKVVHEVSLQYQIGDKAEFWVGNLDSMEQFKITAVMRYETPHLFMWVEEGREVDEGALARSARRFEEHIYPTARAFFGSEWSPGVDNDVHLHVLHSGAKYMGDSIAGYYSSADEYSRLANPYSNEREMFYISLDGAMLPGASFYESVLAHEFQHMIHWANDRNEDTWVNEGCSQLASYLAGYNPGGFEWAFVSNPDIQLTTWAASGDTGPHYGNSYLFMAYFLGRFGEDALKRVVADPANGIAGFGTTLHAAGLTFEDVFADWTVANYLDNVGGVLDEREDNLETRYTYPDHVVGPVAIDARYREYPVQREATVHQYAADYIQLEGNGDLLINLEGDTHARLTPVDAHSGQYAWWSNRGDDSDATLTRLFDLRSVDRATMQVSMWYDLEEHWDYAYVEASVDGGQTWDTLAGPSTTDSNPNGNSLGMAYTGSSEDWIEEKFDLTPYVGHEVLIRFECVTDDAVNLAGWLIDDIRIPELGYQEDWESGEGEWQSSGFVYSDNRVSQRYIVHLLAFGEQTRVLRVPLEKDQRAHIELRGLGRQIDSAVLIVSALAPVTSEPASYRYVIEPLAR